jgi:hypothetical protein
VAAGILACRGGWHPCHLEKIMDCDSTSQACAFALGRLCVNLGTCLESD